MDRFTVTGKMRIAFAVMIIITAVMASYNFAKSNFQDTLIKDVELTEKLEIGKPEYVGFEEINTADYNLEKDDSSSYSQIEIKNISDETLYEISVEMAEQETATKNHFLIPSYHISILRSGESALLSSQHENVKQEQPLKVTEASYRDSEGNAILISGSFDQGQSRNIKAEPNIKTEFKSLSEEVDKIRTGEIIISQDSGQKTAQVEVTNKSSDKLYDVYINFQEYYDGKAVGNLYSRLEVLDGGFGGTIKINTKPDTELKISDIGYRLKTSDNQNAYVYSIYPQEKTYKTSLYGSVAASRTSNPAITFARLAAIIIFLEVNRREAAYRIKGIKEGNDEYLKKAGYAAIIKWITLVIYIVLVADLFMK
ncbi:hypothetical protein [Proteocatella sphenisci]|uniref:hypothetical protein n=1 Tax=Proteocatella sphenisci TaxID=181070 RepID=UPI000491AFC3|nr:hypothetical protein [Proteocatella sphenisci]